MKYFTKEELLIFHHRLLNRYGGTPGVRMNVLDVCLFQPLQTFEERDLYPDVMDKLCMLAYMIITKHPFVDGNKRLGMLALILGARNNNISLALSNEDVIHIGLSLADGSMTYTLFRKFIAQQQKSQLG